MPKKHKILTRTLYTYVRPINNQWVRQNYKKAGFSSYSEYLDVLISAARQGAVKITKKAAKAA